MSDKMAELLAKKFIQRRDVKARQGSNGAYYPVTDCQGGNCTHENDVRLPFKMSDLHSHLNKQQSFGHYLVDHDDKTKLFAFDVDLEQEGTWVELPDVANLENWYTDAEYDAAIKYHQFNPREAWLDRSHPSRSWLKFQLRLMAEKLSRTIKEEFDLPVACAYSGSKGIHVYGFTGSVPAQEAREAAELVLSLVGGFELYRGKNFYRTTDQTPLRGFPNLSIEVFPKQTTLDGKDLGNLMRLPLGRNMKTTDPTFFLDQTAPLGQLAPHKDPEALLENGNPWA